MNREEPGPARGPVRPGPLLGADGWALMLASVASRLYLGVLLSLALIAVLPALLGWHGTVVQSGSMEPHISAGDVVLAAGLDAAADVPVGGVVESLSPAAAEPGGVEKTRLHRIVAENPDGTFVTAGDANSEVDSTPLSRGQIAGQARLLVPALGLPGLWLSGRNFPALAWWSVLTLLAVVVAVFGAQPPDASSQADRRLLKAAAAGIIATLVVLVLATSAVFSSAAFTAATANAGTTFGTAADWTPPSVTLANPGPTVKSAVMLTADASDAETGVRSVAIQYQLPGGGWAALCTVAAPPYACAWNTRAGADGTYRLRAVATDNSGLTSVSAEVQTTVANSFAVVLNDPGEVQRGTVTLSAGLSNQGTTPYAVHVEYAPAGTGRWNTLCQNLVAPYTCTWATGDFANDYYDLRAVATAGTPAYSETLTDVLVDNLAPTVSINVPGSALRGVVTLAADAVDVHSGVAQVQHQYARAGAATWSPVCTVTEAPYSCRFDTTTLAAGPYSFRAIATDEAGSSTTSAAVGAVVDNTGPSASLEDPGPYLTGSIRLSAAANSTAGVAGVRIQTAPAGTGSWTTRCSLAAVPYACQWDTRTVPDARYDLRAVLSDGAGKETISAPVTGRMVDNSPLRAADVQAANGSGLPGRLHAGDTLTFTYSQQINPASVTPGWTGAALPVTLRLRDGNAAGLGTRNGGDILDLQRPGSTVNLGTVNTKANFANNRKTVSYTATMTAATVSAAGVPRTVVTVTLGGVANGGNGIRTSGSAAAMVWTPTSSVTSTAGVVCSPAPATETGTSDRDF